MLAQRISFFAGDAQYRIDDGIAGNENIPGDRALVN
jgi:hypothetical protein